MFAHVYSILFHLYSIAVQRVEPPMLHSGQPVRTRLGMGGDAHARGRTASARR